MIQSGLCTQRAFHMACKPCLAQLGNVLLVLVGTPSVDWFWLLRPPMYAADVLLVVRSACHNLLRAHAAAVKTYRTWYQPTQGGKIGLTTNVVWAEPLTNSFEGRRYIPAFGSTANGNRDLAAAPAVALPQRMQLAVCSMPTESNSKPSPFSLLLKEASHTAACHPLTSCAAPPCCHACVSFCACRQARCAQQDGA